MTFVKKRENRQKSFLLQSVAILALLLLVAVSCKDDDEPAPVITNSPAYYIAEAEKKLRSSDFPSQVAYQGEIVMTLYATGVQKYKAVVSSTSSTGYAWSTASTPQAFLFDRTNAQVGTHFGGPSWGLHGNSSKNCKPNKIWG